MSPNDKDVEPPFRAHRRYYIFLKLAVLAIAAVLALRYLSPLIVG